MNRQNTNALDNRAPRHLVAGDVASGHALATLGMAGPGRQRSAESQWANGHIMNCASASSDLHPHRRKQSFTGKPSVVL